LQGLKIVAKAATYKKKINSISIRHNPKTVRTILLSMALTKKNKHKRRQLRTPPPKKRKKKKQKIG